MEREARGEPFSEPFPGGRAVGNVARARGMTTIAQETRMGRPGLYKALYGERDPRIGTVMKVLAALDIQLTIAPKQA